MQTNLRLIAKLIVARHKCTYVWHCKENPPIYMYYVAPETPMMSSVIADCPDLAPPNILDKSTPMIMMTIVMMKQKLRKRRKRRKRLMIIMVVIIIIQYNYYNTPDN